MHESSSEDATSALSAQHGQPGRAHHTLESKHEGSQFSLEGRSWLRCFLRTGPDLDDELVSYNQSISQQAQAVAQQAQAAVDIKKTQEYDAYYAQKAKEDTVKLQIQIEADKKIQQAEAIKNTRIAKIAENKKRIEEMRKKIKERLVQKKSK